MKDGDAMPTPKPISKPKSVLDTQSRAVARDAIHDGSLSPSRPRRVANENAAARSRRRAGQGGGGVGRMLSQSAALGSLQGSVDAANDSPSRSCGSEPSTRLELAPSSWRVGDDDSGGFSVCNTYGVVDDRLGIY